MSRQKHATPKDIFILRGSNGPFKSVDFVRQEISVVLLDFTLIHKKISFINSTHYSYHSVKDRFILRRTSVVLVSESPSKRDRVRVLKWIQKMEI